MKNLKIAGLTIMLFCTNSDPADIPAKIVEDYIQAAILHLAVLLVSVWP